MARRTGVTRRFEVYGRSHEISKEPVYDVGELHGNEGLFMVLDPRTNIARAMRDFEETGDKLPALLRCSARNLTEWGPARELQFA